MPFACTSTICNPPAARGLTWTDLSWPEKANLVALYSAGDSEIQLQSAAGLSNPAEEWRQEQNAYFPPISEEEALEGFDGPSAPQSPLTARERNKARTFTGHVTHGYTYPCQVPWQPSLPTQKVDSGGISRRSSRRRGGYGSCWDQLNSMYSEGVQAPDVSVKPPPLALPPPPSLRHHPPRMDKWRKKYIYPPQTARPALSGAAPHGQRGAGSHTARRQLATPPRGLGDTIALDGGMVVPAPPPPTKAQCRAALVQRGFTRNHVRKPLPVLQESATRLSSPRRIGMKDRGVEMVDASGLGASLHCRVVATPKHKVLHHKKGKAVVNLIATASLNRDIAGQWIGINVAHRER